MNSADANKWWEVMSAEMETLEVDLKAWKFVKREPSIKVLPCTWAFHIKYFLGGLDRNSRLALHAQRLSD